MTYVEWLLDACGTWIAANYSEYLTLRAEVKASFRRTGKPDPAKGSLTRRMLDDATLEAIRKRNGWPSERQHESGVRLPI